MYIYTCTCVQYNNTCTCTTIHVHVQCTVHVFSTCTCTTIHVHVHVFSTIIHVHVQQYMYCTCVQYNNTCTCTTIHVLYMCLVYNITYTNHYSCTQSCTFSKLYYAFLIRHTEIRDTQDTLTCPNAWHPQYISVIIIIIHIHTCTYF